MTGRGDGVVPGAAGRRTDRPGRTSGRHADRARLAARAAPAGPRRGVRGRGGAGALGPAGTLVVPAFTPENSDTSRAHLARVAGLTEAERARVRADMPAFDPAGTPAPTMGRFAETVRLTPAHGAAATRRPPSPRSVRTPRTSPGTTAPTATSARAHRWPACTARARMPCCSAPVSARSAPSTSPSTASPSRPFATTAVWWAAPAGGGGGSTRTWRSTTRTSWRWARSSRGRRAR